MSLTRINNNIAAQNAARNLTLNTARISSSMEKLSSGLRINRAADDPSGLVMSEVLRAQISGLDSVQQSVLEGVNVIKTAEAALNEVSSLLRQMQDLALTAASPTNLNATSREALNAQLVEAMETIDQIASTTAYAGTKLLDGSLGFSVTENATTEFPNDGVNIKVLPPGIAVGWSGDVDIAITQELSAASITTSQIITVTGLSVPASATVTVTINGTGIAFTGAPVTGTTYSANQIVDAINAQNSATGVTASLQNVSPGFDQIVLTHDNLGADHSIAFAESGSFLNGGTAANATGTDALGAMTLVGAGVAPIALTGDETGVLRDAYGNTFTPSPVTLATGTYSSIATVTKNGEAAFQIGTNANDLAVQSIQAVNCETLGIDTCDVSTVSGANAAIPLIQTAIETLSAIRGELGAFQSNTLESQSRSLAVARENLSASESAIRDVDFGSEMAEFSTSQILVQSATSFLAQANSLPQNVLQLIKGG